MEKKQHSYALERFAESYFGDTYTAWHDGLDTNSLAALEGDERKEAERKKAIAELRRLAKKAQGRSEGG